MPSPSSRVGCRDYGRVSWSILLLILLLRMTLADGRIQRLPREVWPLQYTLTIRTDPLGATFDGNVTIEVEVRETTDNVTLHAKGLALGPIQVTLADGSKDGDGVIVSRQEISGGLLTLGVSPSLESGVRYLLHIPFSGRLNTGRLQGYYRLRTGSQEFQWMSGTVFELNHAREAFPCFDEPEYKARFRVSLVHHRNHTALSNMPLLSSENLSSEDGLVVDHFDNSPIMSTYLVAFHLLHWEHRDTSTEDGRPLKVWAPAKQLRWANNTLSVAPRALGLLQGYTAVSDPMPKLDMVCVPKFHGALENWGVISFLPEGLLYKPHWEGSLKQVLNTKVVTHELAHTWFGNLVTPLWWDSVWLSEGAATFFTSLTINQLEPEWDQLTEDSGERLTQTFYSNAVETGRPLSYPVEWSRDLRSISHASYFKGFSLIRMLYYSLGPEQFQKGIRRYLSQQQYGSATPEVFYEAMQYSYKNKSLTQLMDTWTYQLGLPVVTANRTDNKLILSQERFSFNLDQSERKARTVSKWWVPLSYTTQSERQFEDARPKLWFDEETTLADPAQPSDWLLLNLQASGTYHVRYDKTNLQLLKTALTNSSLEDIPPMNRQQLVIDYGMFALAGLEPLSEVLELSEFLAREHHFAPWAAGLRTFWRMEKKLTGTPAGNKLKERVRRLLTPEFSRLGMRTRKGDKVPTIRQRNQIVEYACLYKLPDCVKRSEKLFQKWTEQQEPDKVNPIPPDLRFTVYCSAARYNGDKHWDFLLERAVRARDPSSRENMFIALGCTDQHSLLYSIMEKRFDNSSMTRSDFTKLLQGLVQYNNDIGPVLDFMERSLLKMKSKSKKKLRWNQNILKDLAQQIVEPRHMQQLKNMASSSKTWTEEEMAVVQQMVEHNASWREKNKNIL